MTLFYYGYIVITIKVDLFTINKNLNICQISMEQALKVLVLALVVVQENVKMQSSKMVVDQVVD